MKAAGLIRPPPVAMAGIEGVKTGRKRSDGEELLNEEQVRIIPCFHRKEFRKYLQRDGF